MGISGHAIGSAVRARRDGRTRSILVAAVLPVLACLFLGTPSGEVEHVLLPFVPLVVVGAAAAARNWYDRGERWLLIIAVPMAVLQSVLIEVFTETLW
jgi:hypothetical protein